MENNNCCTQLPSGLHLLSIPHRPWFYIVLDVVTGLPPSRGTTQQVLQISPFPCPRQVPFSGSSQSSWIEYAHNSHISSATGLSPFQELGSDVAVSSVQHPQQRSHQVRAAFLHTADQNCHQADHQRTLPPLIKVRKFSHLPQTSTKVLVQKVGALFESVISPSAVKLKRPPSFRIHPPNPNQALSSPLSSLNNEDFEISNAVYVGFVLESFILRWLHWLLTSVLFVWIHIIH